MIFKDYYKILGLENNKCTIDDIKIAYRERAKKYHPDMNIGDSNSEEIFKDINEAYRVLSDEKLKRKYDFNWNRYIGKRKKKSQEQEKKTIKEILIEIFFGGVSKKSIKKKNGPVYGENISTEINISIQEAFYGVKKVIQLRSLDGKETSFTFNVPAGIQNHDKIRVIGQGKLGTNGGKNGDLFIIINIQNDKRLRLDGVDLYTELPINVYEAALGTKASINILGEKIIIIVPECTSSGKTFMIKEKGYKDGKGMRGNLYVTTKIILPQVLNEESKKIYNQLKNMESKSS